MNRLLKWLKRASRHYSEPSRLIPMVITLGNLLLALSAFYHLAGGVMSLGPTSWTKTFGNKLYSLNFPEKFDARYQLTVRAVGAFALFTATVCLYGFFSENHEVKKLLLAALGGLFLLRALLRYFQKDLFLEAYGIDFKRSLKNIIFNILLTCVTVILAIQI